MPRLYVHAFTVPPAAIDAMGHVNNIEYVRWMQDVAIEHSAFETVADEADALRLASAGAAT